MEDNNKTWLNVGNNQIDQSLFLTNAANNVNSYVNNKPWSEQRKQSFFNAYQALMSTGITGADNSSGQWELTTQSPLDESHLPPRSLNYSQSPVQRHLTVKSFPDPAPHGYGRQTAAPAKSIPPQQSGWLPA